MREPVFRDIMEKKGEVKMKPEKKYYPRPLWFWNAKPTPEGIREIMRNSAERDGDAGFGFVPYDACGLEYLGDEYLGL